MLFPTLLPPFFVQINRTIWVSISNSSVMFLPSGKVYKFSYQQEENLPVGPSGYMWLSKHNSMLLSLIPIRSSMSRFRSTVVWTSKIPSSLSPWSLKVIWASHLLLDLWFQLGRALSDVTYHLFAHHWRISIVQHSTLLKSPMLHGTRRQEGKGMELARGKG